MVLYVLWCHTSIKNGVLMTQKTVYNILIKKNDPNLCVHYDYNFLKEKYMPMYRKTRLKRNMSTYLKCLKNEKVIKVVLFVC